MTILMKKFEFIPGWTKDNITEELEECWRDEKTGSREIQAWPPDNTRVSMSIEFSVGRGSDKQFELAVEKDSYFNAMAQWF